MKIIRLQASGIKRLVAVDITPGDGMNRVGGFNGEGKSSLLDTIAMAFGGADAIPMKPLRTGEEYGVVRAYAGTDKEVELIVTRFFDEDGTTSLKVTNGDGATYDKGQTKLNGIIGAISFDPVRFADMDPKAQAAELRQLVPLGVDLDALAASDKADTAARRDINRDAKAKLAQIEAINISGIIPERPDRDAILAGLSSAGATNAAIESERGQRDRNRRAFEAYAEHIERKRDRAAQLRLEADRLTTEADAAEKEAAEGLALLAALPALAEPVNTAKLSEDLAKADRDLALLARVDEKARLQAEFDALKVESAAYTKSLTDRAELREKALSEAAMPVEGLSFATIGDDMVVTFNGEPFAQSSRAEQIRVSMRIAMASNPKLRVMTIRDGSLLDERGFKLISEIAAEGGYQVFVEVVGEGEDNGIIIEDGRVKGAPEPELIPPPKRRKAKGEAVVNPATGEVLASPSVQDGPVVDVFRERLEPAEKPKPKPKPVAMREFSTKPAGGDLFGGDK